MLDVSIIIVTYNSAACVSRCLSSLALYVKELSYEVIVVDNNSSDNTVEQVSTLPGVRLVRNQKNVGFAAANNVGLNSARGKYILILNPDIVFSENTGLQKAVGFLENRAKAGLVSIRLLYEDGSLQESARKFPSPFTFFIRGFKMEKFFGRFAFYRSKFFDAALEQAPIEVDWVIGAFMLMKKEIIERIGGFDRKYFMYYEDADLCLKIKRQGFEIVYLPNLLAIHSYRRESAKPLISKLKWIHLKSFLRFSFRLNFAKNHI